MTLSCPSCFCPVQIKSKWTETETKYGYDFWYQPRLNVLLTSGWGAPKAFTKVGGILWAGTALLEATCLTIGKDHASVQQNQQERT